MDTSQLPTSFGPYTLKRKLARGGMAELFLGEMSGAQGFIKPVVIKMIHGDLCDDPRFVEMFTNEAKTVSSFVHGNIVPIFDFGAIDGRTYLAMEFIDGVDLGALTEICALHGLPLRPEVSLWVGIGAASALHYAHRTIDAAGRLLGVVHRDISPQNILVSRAGEVKLCDFGIAQSAATASNTDAGVIKGKLLYLAPEQARTKTIDHRCDIFGLGVTLYEMLAGHHPLANKAGVSIVRALAEGTGYPPLSEVAAYLPSSVTAIIDKATQFEPAARFQSAEELRAELSRVLHVEYPGFSPESLGSLVREVQALSVADASANLDSALRANLAAFASEVRQATQTWHARVERQRRRKVVGWAAVVAVFVAVAAGVLWVMTPPPSLILARASAVAGSSFVDVTRFGPGPAAWSSTPRMPETGPVPSARPPASTPTNSSAVRAGLLEANATPWADVTIDGIPRGSTPLIGLELKAGPHVAVFTYPDTGAQQRRPFVIRPGETTRIIVSLEP